MVPATPAGLAAYAKTVIDMPDGKAKNDVLQQLGLGLNQLKAMNEAAFTTPELGAGNAEIPTEFGFPATGRERRRRIERVKLLRLQHRAPRGCGLR